MFEPFGETANNVIRIAEKEAKKMGHKLVGTEHILLAILVIEDCIPSRIMQKFGISQEILRKDLIQLTGWGEKLDFGGNLIFDPCAKKAMEYATEEMAHDQKEFISIEHLFMGITRKNETIASILLEKRGQLRNRIREEIRNFMEQAKRHEKINDTSPIDEDYRKNKTELDMIKNLLQRVNQLENRLSIAEKSLRQRTGIGFDSHMLVKGRDLYLGGIKIPFSMGLKGHSDADVLIHAIIDAVLGAMGWGDIGTHFPDTDRKYKDISSISLLAECVRILRHNKFYVSHLDSIVIAEKPRLAPYIEEMRKIISRTLKTEPAQISIKAKTAEGMGLIGEGRGIASYAVATLYPANEEQWE